MRRSVAAVVVALSTAVSVTSATTSSYAGSAPGTTSAAAQHAQAALRTAQQVMSGTATGREARTSPTLALTRLYASLDHLSGRSLSQAKGLLGRPTDGPNDPYGDGYTVPAKKKCSKHICIHWVPTTADAPPSKAWVNKMLKMMNHVWKFETGKLGYRTPLKDGHRGGNSKFDVYLKDVFPKGYYGYCAPDGRVSYSRRLLSGFCVLDNDFARSQYGAPPIQSAKVTAAHEFFHAVQFAYDALEDPWMMESTATWMEEQFDDSSNDNRQYLPDGQLAVPGRPLDTFQRPCCSQYANWLFFEYLSKHYGRGIVKKVWNQAAAYGKHAGHKFSTQAIAAALRSHGGFSKVFASYAAGNITPSRTYPEGKHYPDAGFVGTWHLSKGHRHVGFKTVRVKHLASQNLRVVPAKSLSGKKWHLRVKIHAPKRKKAPAVMLVVHKRHGWIKKRVHLGKSGRGHASVTLNRKQVGSVTITLANTSTKFHACGHGKFSCGGKPNVKVATFKVKAIAYKS